MTDANLNATHFSHIANGVTREKKMNINTVNYKIFTHYIIDRALLDKISLELIPLY